MSDMRELAAAYALGAVDADERAALDALLAHDADFRREVDAFREVGALMAYAAPTVAAPGALRDRILNDARAVRSIAAAPSARAAVVASSRWTRVVPWLAAAACAAFAVFSYGGMRQAREAMVALSGELTQVRTELQEKDRTLTAFMGPEVHVVSLAEANNKPTARVYWNHTRNVFIVTAFNVPRAPEGKTYQLWAISKALKAPLSMGTFNTDEDGRATIIVPVGSDVNAIDVVELCAMTLEPAGGSPAPTETPRLVGSWRHTD
jgi:anti-sigma-K factor RskA